MSVRFLSVAENELVAAVEYYNREKLRQIVGRLGAADEREFQPTWEELDRIVGDLGYELRANPTLVDK